MSGLTVGEDKECDRVAKVHELNLALWPYGYCNIGAYLSESALTQACFVCNFPP